MAKKELKKTRKPKRSFSLFSLYPKSDKAISAVVFLLMLFGSFMIVSTNVGQTTTKSNVVVMTAFKQTVFMIVSYFILWAANRFFSLRLFSRLQGLLIPAYWAIMCIPFAFSAQGGSQSWIRLPGGFTIQPSEFAKPLMIVITAAAISLAIERPKRNRSFFAVLRTPIITYIGIAILIVLQRDIGTLAIITMIFFICFISGDLPVLRSMQNLAKGAFIVGSVSVVLLMGFSNFIVEVLENTPFAHIAVRIDNAKNPYNDPYGDGYQPANALYGIADSNFFGKGLGGSSRKYGYLTQADNDYIFAVVIEETGIFGLSALIFLYGVLFYRLFYYAFKTNHMPYKIILSGHAGYLFMHFFFNVGGVGALIPMTGVPLLFISSGGSALMAICLMTGISQRCISEIKIKEMNE